MTSRDSGPRGVRVVLDVRALQEPARAPRTAAYLEGLLSAFDADPGVPLSYRQFVSYAAPWEPLPDDGLPRFPERRPPGVG